MATGRIEITRRKAGWRDKMRAYRVLIDGHVVGRIREGEVGSYDLPAGAHEVRIKLDWASSPALVAPVVPDATTRLTCGPAGTATSALWTLLSGPGQYIVLEPASGSP